ncbi:MAG TPA: M23 family metallopeptidase, partial [Dermatophilaceae bacterium]|nr:M23 family metallopeptidase [Dermatophilaceae bacterium]
PMAGYGHLITLQTREGGRVHSTRYGHMFANGLQVRTGQSVASGQVIGNVGNDGNSTGPHLHFETWVDDRAVDPVAFMTARGVAL